MGRNGLVPKWFFAIFSISTLVFYVWYSGIWHSWVENGKTVYGEKVAKGITLQKMATRVHLLQEQARANQKYSVKEYAYDLSIIRQLEDDCFQPMGFYSNEATIMFLLQKAKSYSFSQYLPNVKDQPGWLMKDRKEMRFRREFTAAREPYLIKERANSKWPGFGPFLVGWLRLYILFLPAMFLILVVRIATCYQSVQEIAACIYWDWQRLLGATLAGVFSFEFYDPEFVLGNIHNDLVWQKHTRRYHYQSLGMNHDKDLAWGLVVQPGEVFANFVMLVWLRDWRLLIPRPWDRRWRYAIYMTCVMVVYVFTTKLPASAGEENDKQLLHPQGLFLGVKQQEGKPAFFTTALLFKEGEFWVFAFNQHNVYEINPYLIHWKQGKSTADIGLTLDFNETEVVAYGAYAFVNFQLGDWKLAGPYYLNKASSGGWSFNTPNFMFSTPLGTKHRIGLGSEFRFEQGKKPKILIGPWFQAKWGQLIARFRIGELITGPDIGKRQGIVHLIYAF